MMLSPEDHVRINAAIAEAETRTSGEIFCILAREVSDYREIPVVWAALAALVLPLALIPLGFSAAWFDWVPFFGGWTIAHSSATDSTVAATLFAYAAMQAMVFGLASLLVSLPAVRRALTPARTKQEQVHRAALQQFLAKGLHLTEGRTGVLIFASLGDHVAEVVADEGIYRKVSSDVWEEALGRLTAGLRAGQPADGFVAAVEMCGAVLAEHFPPTGQNPNEIPDALIEI